MFPQKCWKEQLTAIGGQNVSDEQMFGTSNSDQVMIFLASGCPCTKESVENLSNSQRIHLSLECCVSHTLKQTIIITMTNYSLELEHEHRILAWRALKFLTTIKLNDKNELFSSDPWIPGSGYNN